MIRVRRQLVAVGALACAASALGAQALAGSGGGVRVMQTGGARFPDRSFVLSLPSPRALTASDVAVEENGRPVSHLSMVPAGRAGKGAFGVVLVVDASWSMHGHPITAAVQAARAFAEQRSPNEQIAVVTFNKHPNVVLPFTTDDATIAQALASEPPLAGGTRIYDAVAVAERLLADAKIAVGSVVVLSDGSDTGSAATSDDVIAAARQRHVRIFGVGLRSKAFDPGALAALAHGAGGHYSEANGPEALTSIYTALGSEFAHEYLLRYRSLAGPATSVTVRVKVRGVGSTGTAAYTTPALPSTPLAPYRKSFAERFLRSPASMLAVSLGCGLLGAFALVALVRPRPRTLPRRMAEFVSVQQPQEQKATTGGDRLLGRAERSLSRTAWWDRFKEELDVAQIEMSPVHIVMGTALITLVAVWLFAVLVGSPIFGVAGLAVPFVVRGLIRRKLTRQRDLFAEQLPDNLSVLSSALRAGHSLVGALSVVVDDAPEPARSEFQRVVADEQLGVPLDQGLSAAARRMASRDLEQVALVSVLQHETGGNTAEVLDRVGETVRDRFELRRLVRTLTAQGRMSRWIVSLLPVGLLVLISLLNSAYMAPLFTHPLGRVLLFGAAVMIVAGSLVIKRIVDIKV